MNIDDLIRRLKTATCRSKGDDYDFHVLSDSAEIAAAEKVIFEWATEQITEVNMTKRCAELEAKCYAYEKIIANSNFAPMLRAGVATFVPDPTEIPVPTEIIQESVTEGVSE